MAVRLRFFQPFGYVSAFRATGSRIVCTSRCTYNNTHMKKARSFAHASLLFLGKIININTPRPCYIRVYMNPGTFTRSRVHKKKRKKEKEKEKEDAYDI
ncbi:hypothetical protein POVWA2_001250 [Plasmodium ovale wallikeri]|uniref:Uncharacterized protein n=1 Tax=Plasmodium ovale wallikeri TaxID=864142 RepID=A0A1A8YH67_PLAOA|nr:hypothetical protein POVWA1_000990 [Plasmodium ovale wallikeri]SBT30895.1 hypothetical protein POVWA2_001250 [Plasmodium ovale wallikeri]